ncbi:MAG: UvrD-helicase domain-containing protein [Bacilli bacterium]|nr:UvrD-helicase domain-containing protein [Bacilli bacterium]
MNVKLDNYQKEVVLNSSKSILVVAGAGSGKSTTILAKIKYLINIKNIKNNEILLLSFGRKNKNEMNEKLKNLNINIDVFTFHELGLKFLKNVTIINDDMRKKLISDIINSSLDDFKFYLYSIFYLLINNTILLFSKKRIKYILNNTLTNDTLEFIDKIKLYDLKVNKSKNFKIFYTLFKTIYSKYNIYLNKNNLIEFEDIIIKSKDKIKSNYKYIIVDEYQDISKNRFIFFKKLIDYNNSNFIGVGDDFQAIYGFSGSNIEYFTNIGNYIPDIKILKLINTYRNSQELINVAGKFILKNNKQINKKLISKKHITSPIILICDRGVEFIKILEFFNKNKVKSVGILSRFNFGLNKYINLLKKEDDHYIYKNLKIYFTTVHKSKGLEYDEVIILNLNNGTYGFPSKKKNKKIFSQYETNDIYEERRLFYVALTRTRNRVYILYNKKNKSSFIKEIKKEIKYLNFKKLT